MSTKGSFVVSIGFMESGKIWKRVKIQTVLLDYEFVFEGMVSSIEITKLSVITIFYNRYLKGTNAKFPGNSFVVLISVFLCNSRIFLWIPPDPLTKLWPCVIELKNVHNHSVESADSLQYRPVNEATRKKVAELFTKGHSPTSVSESLKLDLLIENAEMYEEREKDASYCPLPSFCYREYSKIMGNSYRCA